MREVRGEGEKKKEEKGIGRKDALSALGSWAFVIPVPQVCVRGCEAPLPDPQTTHWRESAELGQSARTPKKHFGLRTPFTAKTIPAKH